MEKFKACEKELKTKAYSKEGLSQSVKMDPAEKERMEISNWIQETVEKLGTQVDAFETEQEVLSAALRRSSKKAQDIAKAQRLAMVENQVIRHKHHVGKLEIILRMLENGNLSVEQVNGIFFFQNSLLIRDWRDHYSFVWKSKYWKRKKNALLTLNFVNF